MSLNALNNTEQNIRLINIPPKTICYRRGLYENVLEIDFLVVSDLENTDFIRYFSSHDKILFPAEAIASQRSAFMFNYIACAIFNQLP